MKLFGFNITRPKVASEEKDLTAVAERDRGWFRILESFAGAWQMNVEVDFNSVLSFHAVYACMTLIASDIAKLRVKLVALDETSGIWEETKNPAYDPVLRKPNGYQTRIQFWENWMLSKLMRGNVYVLKRRDSRNVVVALYILDPNRVRPLVADDGQVFYELLSDNLSNLAQTENIVVPASEIIHDRYNCLFHPLIGTSPIYACGLAATQGLNIQANSTKFFQNLAMPSGILLAPGAISNDTATRLKSTWETNYTGTAGIGKVAVLGDNLKFQPLTMTSVDAQLIEQLKWTAEVVCSTFHVPPYKIGIGAMPSFNNIQSLNVEYYSQALQILIEAAEVCLDEGLATGEKLGTEFDIENLLRMDSVTQMDVIDKGKNTLTPNESRKRLGYGPVTGGDSVYRQQQDFSLEALAKRDAQDNPFQTSAPAAKPDTSGGEEPAPAADQTDQTDSEDQTDKLIGALYKHVIEGEFNYVRF